MSIRSDRALGGGGLLTGPRHGCGVFVVLSLGRRGYMRNLKMCGLAPGIVELGVVLWCGGGDVSGSGCVVVFLDGCAVVFGRKRAAVPQ